MKLWKMVSVLGGSTAKAEAIARSNPHWAIYAGWIRDFTELVKLQDRQKLDGELPEAFVREVFSTTQNKIFISTDGTIRSRKVFTGDIEIGLLEAFDRFGGDIIEEVMERGSFKI
jgi:hypothetical protein